AAVTWTLGEAENDEHLVLALVDDAQDAAAARERGVPPNGVAVRREDDLSVLDDLRARREQVRGRLVVGSVERRAPGACRVLGRARRAAAAAGDDRDRDEDRHAPHRGSLPRVEFELTPEQREIQAVARELAAAEIEP